MSYLAGLISYAAPHCPGIATLDPRDGRWRPAAPEFARRLEQAQADELDSLVAPVADAGWCAAATAAVCDPRWRASARAQVDSAAAASGVAIHEDYKPPTRCVYECVRFDGVDHAYIRVEDAATWLMAAEAASYGPGSHALRFIAAWDQILAAAARGLPHVPPAALAAAALRAADPSRVWHVVGPAAPGARLHPLTDAISGVIALPRVGAPSGPAGVPLHASAVPVSSGDVEWIAQ